MGNIYLIGGMCSTDNIPAPATRCGPVNEEDFATGPSVRRWTDGGGMIQRRLGCDGWCMGAVSFNGLSRLMTEEI